MDPTGIWQAFLQKLGDGPFPSERLRPYDPSMTEILPHIVEQLRPLLPQFHHKGGQPESDVTENQVHFLLSFGPGSSEFCLSFLVEEGQWFFQHVETITIRLDQTGAPPVSVFPDVAEETKAWCREELRVTEMVRLYCFLREEKGKQFALDWFRDGAGYFLGARAWVPFLPPPEAFILYICWDLANLQGNSVMLVALDEHRAEIRARLNYFALYRRAVHIAPQISAADYCEIFETIWQDRAVSAGWNIQFSYQEEETVFHFTRL